MSLGDKSLDEMWKRAGGGHDLKRRYRAFAAIVWRAAQQEVLREQISRMPDSVNEALNSGDGSYRP